MSLRTGRAAPKINGLHSGIVARLPIVEQTIRAQGFSGKLAFWGFRFQLSGAGGEHPRGRAFDTTPFSNPHIRDKTTKQLITLITGGATLSTQNENNKRGVHKGTVRAKFEEEFKSRKERIDQVAEIDEQLALIKQHLRTLVVPPKPKRRRGKKAPPMSPAEKQQLEARKKVLEKRRAVRGARKDLLAKRAELVVTAHAAISGVKAPGLSGLQHLKAVHSKVSSWIEANGGEGAQPEHLAKAASKLIDKQKAQVLADLQDHAAKKAKLEAELKRARAESKKTAPYWKLARADTGGEKVTTAQWKALYNKRKAAHKANRKRVKAADKAIKQLGSTWSIKRRLGKLEDLDEKITKQAQRYFGHTKSRTVAPKSLMEIKKQGIVDLPEAVVKGFMMCGWRWGGTWSSSDAMHFEYPIPLAGVYTKKRT